MCIAIYSLKGTEIPADDILKTCFRNNPDGAGFAFNTDDGKVQIVKGLMTWDSFITAFKEYDFDYHFKNRGVLIHFRIATHGQTNEGCTHPFPISIREKHLKKTNFVTDYAAIHNGVISLTADSKSRLSDTMLFIRDYLTKISSNKGWFHNPKNIELIEMLIDSKMAILSGSGDVISTEGFEQGTDGNFYSNDSYKASYFSFYDFYEDWFEDDQTSFLECPLMRFKKNEILYYEDGNTEEYEPAYHGLYPIYLTKEGDIYEDFEECAVGKRLPMDRLTYMGRGKVLNSLSPINIVEFRNDLTGFI